jgi:hypothetical protein
MFVLWESHHLNLLKKNLILFFQNKFGLQILLVEIVIFQIFNQVRQIHSRNDLGEFRRQREGHRGRQSESHRGLRSRDDDSAQESRLEKDTGRRIETLLRSGPKF